MQERYCYIELANAAWGTNFPSWEAVSVPPPHTCPGRFWEDVLEWYGQVRDEHVIWALKMTSHYTSKPLIIYGGAGHMNVGHWQLAVASGGADWPKGIGDFRGFFSSPSNGVGGPSQQVSHGPTGL